MYMTIDMAHVCIARERKGGGEGEEEEKGKGGGEGEEEGEGGGEGEEEEGKDRHTCRNNNTCMFTYTVVTDLLSEQIAIY